MDVENEIEMMEEETIEDSSDEAVPNVEIVKEGNLFKRGEVIRNWRPRFGHFLKYL